MPNAPATVCSTPACGGRRTNGVCDRGCNATKNGTARRNSTWQSSRLYRTARWQKRAKAQLKKEPVCRECNKTGRSVAATVADHIVPWDGDVEAFYEGELQSLCVHCHGSKSAGERRRPPTGGV